MGRYGFPAVLLAVAALSVVPATPAADDEVVPVYTSEDLDRMFGPAPAGPSVPVDKTRPEDWGWVEQFIDRQYARVDADRQYDLDRRALDIAAGRVEPVWTGYGHPLAWGLGYPASTWWNSVWGHYAVAANDWSRTPRDMARSTGRVAAPRGAHGAGNGRAHRAR